MLTELGWEHSSGNVSGATYRLGSAESTTTTDLGLEL